MANPSTNSCPDPELLQAYGHGKLDSKSRNPVHEHVTACVTCRSRLSSMVTGSYGQKAFRSFAGDRSRSLPEESIADLPVPMPLAVDVPPELLSLNQYTDIRLLGEGGMGAVYLARNTLMDRDEVLKVIGKQLLAKPEIADRFLREIRAAARLQHPNVVTAYSAQRIGELLVFAMEYVPGQDLSKLVKSRGPLPVQQACYYAYQVALGLQHAHENGMIHRDIKPSNLMLFKKDRRRTIKILDFGLAKVNTEQEGEGLTVAGRILGTPDYIAPEQSVDSSKADIRADIYSLGCTLYYLLAGRAPFNGSSVYEVLIAHRMTQPPLLPSIRPEIPNEVAATVARMLLKEPADRFQTPGEVAEALKPFLKAGSSVTSETANLQNVRTGTLVQTEPPDLPEPPVLPTIKVTRDAHPVPLTGLQPHRKKANRRMLLAYLGLPVAVILSVLVLAFIATRPRATADSRASVILESIPEDAVVELDGQLVPLTRDGKDAGFEIGTADGKSHQLRVKVGEHEFLNREIAPKAGGSPLRIAPDRTRRRSEWAGLGTYIMPDGKGHRAGGSMTLEEEPDGTFRAKYRNGLGYYSINYGFVDTSGDLIFQRTERLKPTQLDMATVKGKGKRTEDRIINIEMEFVDNGRSILKLKYLPEAGDAFKFQGGWKIHHMPNNWWGDRTVNGNRHTTVWPRSTDVWERDGGLIRCIFPNGGLEWLIIDPENPNRLLGSNGSQDVTWTRK